MREEISDQLFGFLNDLVTHIEQRFERREFAGLSELIALFQPRIHFLGELLHDHGAELFGEELHVVHDRMDALVQRAQGFADRLAEEYGR